MNEFEWILLLVVGVAREAWHRVFSSLHAAPRQSAHASFDMKSMLKMLKRQCMRSRKLVMLQRVLNYLLGRKKGKMGPSSEHSPTTSKRGCDKKRMQDTRGFDLKMKQDKS